MTSSGLEGLNKDSDESRKQDDFGNGDVGEDEEESDSDTELEVPLSLHGCFSESDSCRCDETNDGGVESLKNTLSSGKIREIVVGDGEADHHDERREDEAPGRDQRPAEACQFESDIGDGIGGVGTGKTLSE